MSPADPTCPNCRAPISPTARFCGECGKTIELVAPQTTSTPPAVPAIPVPSQPSCPHCGAAISSTAKFCGACGKTIDLVAPQTASTPPAAPAIPTLSQPSCPHCGAAIPLHTKFCGTCGKAIEPSVAQPTAGGAAPLRRKAIMPRSVLWRAIAIAGIGLVLIASIVGLAALTGRLDSPFGATSGYDVRAVAPGQTTPETVTGTTLRDKAATLALRDGTQVVLPASAKPVEVKLSRLSNTVELPQPALQTSGSMRTLEFDSTQVDDNFVPILTIPAKELGDLDLATVNIARIADMQVDGKILKDQVIYLPVTKDRAGNVVVVDTAVATFSQTTASMGRSAGLQRAMPLVQAGGPTTVKYIPMTFQGHLEWQIEPQLVRMIPDSGASGSRRPADPVKDKELLLKPVVNIVVLVHGHNEEEKGGSTAPSTSEPWKVTYKQEVWTEFYKSFLAKKKDQLDCTAFYEFIYPTFRAAYSPVAGNPHAEPLGDSFLAKLKYGAVNDNHQLEKMREANMPANLLVVAHSMGGLVARAGIRQFDGWLKDSFQKLVTWGTPHHGSPLPTLGYVLRGPYRTAYYGVVGGGLEEALANLFAGTRPGGWLEDRYVVLDTPGTRDLRWDNIHPLRLDELVKITTDAIPQGTNEADYDLTSGSWLYNDNLRLFNQSDPYRNTDKYLFIYGVTSKRYNQPPAPKADTAKGATIIHSLVKNPDDAISGGHYGDSDGAVPLASMAGFNLGESVNVGDYDHEEYFASTSSALGPNGDKVAGWTFDYLGLPQPRCKCPQIEILSPQAGAPIAVGSSLDVDAKLKWPIQVASGKPGWPITQAESQININGTQKILNLGNLKLASEGQQKGSFVMPDPGSDRVDLIVINKFADGTELKSKPVPIGSQDTRVQLSVTPVQLAVTEGQKAKFTVTARGIPPTVKSIEWVWENFPGSPVAISKSSGIGESESQTTEFQFSPVGYSFFGFVYLYDTTSSQHTELARFGEILVQVVPAEEAAYNAPQRATEVSPAATPTTAPVSPTATPSVPTVAPTSEAALEEKFFEVWSTGVADNGATVPTTFEIDQAWKVTQMLTYHWNDGQGMAPGTVGLRAADGAIYGPWQAVGVPGNGGLPNAAWYVTPNVVIPPGAYTVLDSDPGSWAYNSETDGAGMAYGIGVRVSTPAPVLTPEAPAQPSTQILDGIYAFKWDLPEDCRKGEITFIPVDIRGDTVTIDYDQNFPFAREKHYVMKGSGTVDQDGTISFTFHTEYSFTPGAMGMGEPSLVAKTDGAYVGPFSAEKGSGQISGIHSESWRNPDGSCTGSIAGGFFQDWFDYYAAH